VRVYILITTEVGRATEVQDELNRLMTDERQGATVATSGGGEVLPNEIGAFTVDVVSGGYDLIVTLDADTAEPIGKLVLDILHKMGGVERTNTLLQLR